MKTFRFDFSLPIVSDHLENSMQLQVKQKMEREQTMIYQ